MEKRQRVEEMDLVKEKREGAKGVFEISSIGKGWGGSKERRKRLDSKD